MSQPTPKSERLTAILSTLVAIAILAAGVTAQQSHHSPQDDLVRLESDLRFQLERAFKHDGSQRTKRMAQVDQVLEAWHNSPQSNQDQQRLNSWLTEATIQSMPGSSQSFPPAPEFGQPAPIPVITTPAKPAPSDNQPSTTKPAKVTQFEKPVLPTTQAPAPLATANPNTVEPHTATTPQPTISPEPAVATTSPIIEITDLEYNTPPQPAPSQAATPHTKLQTASLQTTTKTEEPIHINLVELTARIAGYHNSLDAVETRLLMLDSPNIQVISQQIEKLEHMTRDFHFAKLYYEALTDKQRRVTPAPRSMAATLAEINRHLNRYEESQNDDFLSSFETAESEQLKSLRTQLATIKQRVKQ